MSPAHPSTNGPLGQLALLPPIGLDELVGAATLQTRVERKYVMGAGQVAQLLTLVEGHTRVLEIAGARTFRYESTYFDTPELTAYHLAARRRHQRFKVRTRSYLDSRTTWLEVKLRSPTGTTVKHRIDHPFDDRGRLGEAALAFLMGFGRLVGYVHDLRPTLQTDYSRTTLLVGDTRATLDRDVAGRPADDRRRCAHFGTGVIVETKSRRGVSDLDRLLWRLGVRPWVVSKYGTAMAALDPGLPGNKWRRTLERHVVVANRPDRPAQPRLHDQATPHHR